MRLVLRGFTLIELLIVMAVVGAIAGIVLVAINPGAQLAKVRDTQRKSDIRAIKGALEQYFVINGTYPVTLDGTGTPNIYAWVGGNTGGFWIPGLNSTYLKVMPKDPLNSGPGGPWDGTGYYYYYGSNGTQYNLVALLENASDPQRCELKKWIYVGAGGGGVTWCNPGGHGYSDRMYTTNSRND